MTLDKSKFAPMIEPPYYSVMFSSQMSDDGKGYGEMVGSMVQLAQQQPGFLGMEHLDDETGMSITNSFWKDEQSIINWKEQVKHKLVQKTGKERWYSYYTLRIAKVERAYDGPDGR